MGTLPTPKFHLGRLKALLQLRGSHEGDRPWSWKHHAMEGQHDMCLREKKRCFFGKTDPGKESDKLKIESNI